MDFLRNVGGFQIAILETLTVTIETFLFSKPSTHLSKGKKGKLPAAGGVCAVAVAAGGVAAARRSAAAGRAAAAGV